MNIHILKVTREFCTQGNVRVGRYINGFIPEDAVGSPNKKNGRGRNISLLLSDMDQEVKTDIPADKKIFRLRTPIKDFVRQHSLQEGDKVYLEKIDRRVFRLRPVTKQFTFIDLFAGIGGMRLAFDKAGGKCVFTSEWDKFAQQTYEANFGEKPAGDITKIPSSEIPDHDILLAGFPCQPFSISGVSKKNALGKPHGFDDLTQGTLFFEIQRIIKDVLEKELGYTIYDTVIDADTYVPQHRERIFIVGFKEPLFFSFPQHNPPEKPKFKDILDKEVDSKYTLTDHLWNYLQNYAKKHKANGNGFGFGMTDLNGRSRTLSARYYKDGSEVLIPQGEGNNPRRLTPTECARLMGFLQFKPDYIIPVSDTRAYRQFGNAVVVPVVYDIAKEIIQTLGRTTK